MTDEDEALELVARNQERSRQRRAQADAAAAAGDPHEVEYLATLGTDAEKWASEFARVANLWTERTGHDPLDPEPGNLLHTWFANAIEAGRSAS